MARQWRKRVCALLTGALRKKLTRKCARVGFFSKAHQCAMTRKDRTGSASVRRGRHVGTATTIGMETAGKIRPSSNQHQRRGGIAHAKPAEIVAALGE